MGDPRTWREVVYEHPAFGDERLSLIAVGVFTQVLDLPVGERFSAASVAQRHDDSAATVRAALDELATCGYLAEVAR